MTKIVISPGHYEAYKGVNKNGYVEYDEVKKITQLVKDKLSLDYDVDVVEGVLLDKVNAINDINPVLAVEIHLGNTNNSKTGGSRSFFMLNRTDSKSLAEHLLNSCVNHLGTKDRGAHIGWYKKISPAMVTKNKAPTPEWKAKVDLFLSKTTCPSAIIEPFYISSIGDCEQFISEEQYNEVANAIVEGVHSYLKSAK